MMAPQLLLVDDDPIFWNLVQTVFKEDPTLADVPIHRLSDGTELLDYLQRKAPFESAEDHPWPDVVLLDHRMEQLDGLETLKKMHDEGIGETVTVCLMTGSEDKALVAQALAYGCRFCFTKPANLDGLTVLFAQIVSFFRNVAQFPDEP